MADGVLAMYEKGKKILEEIGGEEAYNRKKRSGYQMPTLELEQKGIVFE